MLSKRSTLMRPTDPLGHTRTGGARLWAGGATILLASVLLIAAPPDRPAAGSDAASTRPDVVIIITDDQRADQLGRMPVTSGDLAGTGVKFDQAFASHPLCCPSRIGILRGQYAHTTGIYSNDGARGGFAVIRDRGLEASTLATWLDAAGYRTGLAGKYFNGYDERTGYVPPGWDYWRGGSPAYYRAGGPSLYHSNQLTRYADEFIRGTAPDTSLFLYLSYLAPHAPSKPAAKYAADPRCDGITTSTSPSFNEADVSDKPSPVRSKPLMTAAQQQYIGTTLPTDQCRALLSVDDGVATVLQALRDTGRLNNTLLVFMSDHGLFLGEHRIQALKILTYEEAIRIPLVIRYDPLTAGVASVDQHLVLNVDIAPTIADLVGLNVTPGCPVPPYGPCNGGFDGRSLVPILAKSASEWRSDILVENHQACGVRTERYAFVRYRTGEEELYDLAADPHQLSNLLFGTRTPATSAIRDELFARLKVLCQPPAPGVKF
jgi:N-acetylglucosamine-6-sulfatase